MCSYRQKKPLPSQIHSITALWRAIPKQPLANQSQQIAVVNISDYVDLNKDIGNISLLHSAFESFLRPSARANMDFSTADLSSGFWGEGKQTQTPSVTVLS